MFLIKIDNLRYDIFCAWKDCTIRCFDTKCLGYAYPAFLNQKLTARVLLGPGKKEKSLLH